MKKNLVLAFLVFSLFGCVIDSDTQTIIDCGFIPDYQAGLVIEYDYGNGETEQAKTLSIVEASNKLVRIAVNGDQQEIVLQGECLTPSTDLTWDESLLLFDIDPLPQNEAEKDTLSAQPINCYESDYVLESGAYFTGSLCSVDFFVDDARLSTSKLYNPGGMPKVFSYQGTRHGDTEFVLNIIDIDTPIDL